MSTGSSDLISLLERNIEAVCGKKVLFMGQIEDENILIPASKAAKAVVLVDNFVQAQKMAALLMQDLGSEVPQSLSHNNLQIILSSPEESKGLIADDFDTVVLFISKSRNLSASLLYLLQDKFKDEALILTAGANNAGGKSADKLIGSLKHVQKRDAARKCTLFSGIYSKEHPFKAPAPPPSLKLCFDEDRCHIKFLDAGRMILNLEQEHGVFSAGSLDEGTALLLETIDLKDLKGKKILDLCCGCGVVGLVLAKFGAQVSFCDVSAQALSLTKKNLVTSGLEGRVIAADFLEGLGTYDLIAVNPPFHQGVKPAIHEAAAMLGSLKSHLNKGGRAYVVSNSFLNYQKRTANDVPLKTVAATSRFVVNLIETY